jgi:hypothetical protein
MRAIPLVLLAAACALSSARAQAPISPRPTIPEPRGVWDAFEFLIPTAATAPGGLSESSPSPHNPWLDYRMQALMVSPTGRTFEVAGFYAADGAGGDSGSVWKLRFTPDEPGTWGFVMIFEHGPRLNVRELSVRGTQVFPSGYPFYFQVGPRRDTAQGFHARGPVEAVGARYLRHRDGTWFLKTGTNSPENLLGYAGFDGARDLGGLPRSASFLHRYAEHRADWRPGDPDWSSGGDPEAGKGIIGALNYLATEGVNSVYFLPLNLGGDGQDTFPFLDPTGTSFAQVTHFDVGRMEQWDTVFEHAQRRGILLEFVLAEQENENVSWLGQGMTDQRKLFLKQMVAMFGHHPGIRWILCEENAPEPNDEFSVRELGEFATWIRRWASLEHPMTVHTDPDDLTIFDQILSSSHDSSWLTSASLQVHSNYNPATEQAHELFRSHGRTVTVHLDELGPAGTGVSASNHDEVRKLVLWDVLLSGGNVAWYCGYHALPVGGDIRLEDFRTRDAMWKYSRHARELLQRFAYWRMVPADGLVTRETRDATYGDAEVLTDPGRVLLIYYAAASQTGMVDLRAAPAGAVFDGHWFDPRTGQRVGAPFQLPGGQASWMPAAPAPRGEDWVAVLERR